MAKTLMSRTLLAGIATALAVLVPTPTQQAWAQQQSSKPALTRAAPTYNWSGSCQVRCADGRCEYVCKSGFVIAVSTADARFKAELALRAQASNSGQVIEGTVRVEVRLGGR